MRISLLITVIIFSIFCSTAAFPYYTITLKNGEELQAEEYRFEGEMINLKLKAGSASFPKVLVAAIAGTGPQGDTSLPAAQEPKSMPQVPPQAQPAGPPALNDRAAGGLAGNMPPPDGDDAISEEDEQEILQGADELPPEDEGIEDEAPGVEAVDGEVINEETPDEEGLISEEGE